MSGLLAQFLTEARDLLESGSQGLLALEDKPGDAPTMDGLFRTVHTIKGASGIFDIPPFTKTVHAAEDVLDAVRDGRLELTSEMVDLLFEIFDQVSQWVDDLASTEKLGDGAEAAGKALAGRLRSHLTDDGAAAGEAQAATAQRAAVPAEWIARIPQPVRAALFKRFAPDGGRLVAASYAPDEQCFFAGTDPFFTVRQAPTPLWRSVTAREPWPDMAHFDPFVCKLRFDVLVADEETAVRDLLRYVEDESWVASLPASSLAVPCGPPGERGPCARFAAEAAAAVDGQDWDALSTSARAVLEVLNPESLQGSAVRWMETVVEAGAPSSELLRYLIAVVESGAAPEAAFDPGGGNETDSAGRGAAVVVGEHTLNTLALQVLDDIRFGLTLAADPAIWNGVAASTGVALGRVLQRLRMEDHLERLDDVVDAAIDARSFKPLIVMIETIAASLAEVARAGAAKAPEAGAGRHKPTVLRVEQERVDRLMDLAGELVVAKNSLPFLAQRAEETYGVRELGREIKTQYEVIDRIADEFQTAVMQVRMVPVGQVFQRFTRLVRDTSRKLGKNVRLVISGEETEADKNIVEELADPLIHLVRNSLDHGIETPEDREAAGKPAEATLQLKATPLDDRVLIEVIDDGKGIDPQVIKAKAADKGMIDPEQVDAMSDRDSLQLIMRAGFSTAERISDLSGRGVGLDVVRNMVESNGGSISLDSEVGKGTTVQVFLPLSMAVTQVMIVDVANIRFGVSIDSIVETVRIPAADIKHVKDREAVVLRNRLIPLARLVDVLDLTPDGEPGPPGSSGSRDEEAVLVVRVADDEIGLVVDRLNAGVDILLKPMEGILSRFKVYSGTALMGDGSVLLVLNLAELMKCL